MCLALGSTPSSSNTPSTIHPQDLGVDADEVLVDGEEFGQDGCDGPSPQLIIRTAWCSYREAVLTWMVLARSLSLSGTLGFAGLGGGEDAARAATELGMLCAQGWVPRGRQHGPLPVC